MRTLRIHPAMPELELTPTGVLESADVELSPLPSVVRVLLPGYAREALAERVGVDGLGTVLAFDRERALTELVLDLKPAERVTLMDAEWTGIIRRELTSARAARPRLVRSEAVTPVAEHVLLGEAIDLAAWLFYSWTGPAERDERSGLEELELVEVARGAWLGVDPDQRRLAAVIVDRVGERQWVQGWSTDALPGAAGALNELHRAFYGHPRVSDWRRRRTRLEASLPGHLASDAGFREAWRRVADSYGADLEFRERLGTR